MTDYNLMNKKSGEYFSSVFFFFAIYIFFLCKLNESNLLNFLYEIETKLYGKKYFHTVMCVHRYNMKSLKCIYFNETY